MTRLVHMLTAAGLLLVSEDAPACTEGLGILAAVPADGDVDVPTDVVPWIATNVPRRSGRLSRSVRLEDSGGALVAAEEHGEDEIVELIPVEPLRPRATYRLVLTIEYEPVADNDFALEPEERLLRFTTGAGPSTPGAPELPGLRATLVRVENPPCGGPLRLCIGSESGESLYVTVRDDAGNAEIDSLIPDGAEIDWPLRTQDAFCVDARARDAAGRVSEPERLCSHELPFVHLAEGAHPECESGAMAAQPSGCATAGVPSWLIVLVRRRRQAGFSRL